MIGQYERVETLATTYLKESPELPDWQFFLGKVYVLRGKTAEAKSALGKAAQERSPIAIDAQLQLGLLLRNLGDVTQSRALFSTVYDRASAASDRLGLAAQALHHLEQ
jgi:TolA-binding protein